MRAVIALLLIALVATASAIRCVCIRAPCPCDKWDSESDWSVTGNVCLTTKYGKICGTRDEIESEFFPALIPIAAFAGKALAGGALSAAGAHAYNKIFRRDTEEADFPWLLAAKLGMKAISAIRNRKNKQQADFPFIPAAIGAWKLYNALKKKDQVESDFFPALIPIAAFAGKALAGGALSAAGAHAYNKIFRRDAEQSEFPFIPVAMGAWKLYNALKKKDQVESEFLGKWVQTGKKIYETGKKYYPKAKAIYGEGKNIYNSVQNIRQILKNKDDVESEFLGKVFNKVKGVVGKGISIYNKAKPFIGIAKNFIDSEESDMVMNKEFLSKLKERLMKKLQEKLAKLKEKKAQKKPVVQKEESDLKIDKCQICKAGCTLIKDEAKRNLCTQACETFACKKD